MAGTTEWTVATKKATTWGTAVAVGAGDGVKITSEGLGEGIPEPIKDENVGDSLQQGSMQGNVSVEGNLVEPVRFAGITKHMASFMGADAVTEVETGVVGLHSMVMQASNTGKFLTVAIDKGLGSLGSAPWEYPSAKISQLERTHENGKLIATWTLIANKCERTVGSQASHAFASITYPDPLYMAVFTQLEVLLKEVTGSEGDLSDSTDEYEVSQADLSLNRNLAGDHVSGGGGLISEPETNGLPTGQLKLAFPNYTSAVDALLKEAQTAQTARSPKIYKAILKWTGPEIDGSAGPENYYYSEEYPALTIAAGPANASGPGAKVPVELTFDIQTPQSVPDGTQFSWVTAKSTPMRVVVQNNSVASAA